jgi:hypothetical protein
MNLQKNPDWKNPFPINQNFLENQQEDTLQ